MNQKTVKLFYKDHYMKEFEAKVIEIDGNKVVLDQTCFFPEGGGQVGDTGEINGIRVLDTVKEGAQIVDIEGQQIPAGGTVYHVMESEPDFSEGTVVKGKIDWERRYKIMRLHSASHFMEHFLYQVFGELPRIGSKVDDRKDRSDYVSEEKFDPEKLAEVQRLCNEFISTNKEIKTYDSEKNENIRVWECGEIKMFCGGTHPHTLGEIGNISLKRKNIGAGKERIETCIARIST